MNFDVLYIQKFVFIANVDTKLGVIHHGLMCLLFEPRHEKTCLQGFPPGKTQTSLCRDTSLEISNIITRDVILSRQRTTKVDAQADLCLCCSHMAKPGFLMMWLIS